VAREMLTQKQAGVLATATTAHLADRFGELVGT
jgi:hypothetical protein